MKVVSGDLWKIEVDYKGITTNGYVTKNGNAVMGRGVALQAKQMFPGIEVELGRSIILTGNHIHFLSKNLFSFPVKHNWWEKADLNLIKQSVQELKDTALIYTKYTFAIPLPGTGNGRLTPEEVWPLLTELPDNVIVVIKE